jgi:hypothetical protein
VPEVLGQRAQPQPEVLVLGHGIGVAQPVLQEAMGNRGQWKQRPIQLAQRDRECVAQPVLQEVMGNRSQWKQRPIQLAQHHEHSECSEN